MTRARRVLVLGGIRSGKSAFAAELLREAAAVRHLATARPDPAGPARPDSWQTVECADDPARLAAELTKAAGTDAVLVDDVGGWLAALLDGSEPAAGAGGPGADAVRVLADAVRSCPAERLVLVSPEIGLAPPAGTPAGRAFADALGAANQALADHCEAVALVVAGRPIWLTGATQPAPPGAPTAAAISGSAVDTAAPVDVPEPAPAAPAGADQPVSTVPGPPDEELAAVRPPDRIAINRARDRLAAALPGTGLGALAEPVAWATGGTGRSGPWESIRLILVAADHGGGGATGAEAGGRYAGTVRDGSAPLARLADRLGVSIQIVDSGLTEPVPGLPEPPGGAARPGPAAPIETADALTADQVDAAIAFGRRLADQAADDGMQLLVPAACGAGVETAAVAALAAATGSEPAALLGRVIGPTGRYDDDSWMARCVAARDALHRVRLRARDARTVLGTLGGPGLATLTGLVLGAAVRQTPVLVDGPTAAAAMVLARDLAPSSPWWCLVPDTGRHPAVRLACDLLGLESFLDLGLGLGDGTAALTAVTVLQPALALAGAHAGG